MPELRKIAYAGWPECVRITNSVFDAVVTTDVGPRIVRYGETGGPDLMYTDGFSCGSVAETKTWRAYGGHSFDVSVNGEPFYPPENTRVAYELTEDSIVFAPVRQGSLQKEISVRMCRRGGLEIIQKVTWLGDTPARVRTRGCTRLQPDGTAVLPLRADAPLCGGERVPEMRGGHTVTLIRRREESRNRFSALTAPEEVWCGYFIRGSLLIMTAPPAADTRVGWRSEPSFAEMSLLSPEKVLSRGESLEQTEVWNIFTELPAPADETEAARMLKDNRYYYDFVRKPVKGLDC